MALPQDSRRVLPTLSGVMALLFWGSAIAFSRRLTEALGVLTSGTLTLASSGILSLMLLTLRSGGLQDLIRLPRRYLFGCGGLFVAYMVCLYLGVGLASGRQQVIEVGIINYLWPSLTLVFSVPLLGKRARLTLVPGIVLAFGGVVLAMAYAGDFSWPVFRQNLGSNGWPYVFAFGAALSWSLYSVLSRRWAGETAGWATPVFLLAAALALAVLRLFRPEETVWTARAGIELAYMVVFPTLLAYTLWEVAMRRGHFVLVTSLSYLTPVLSTFISGLYLDVRVGPGLWGACGMVVAGALLCKWSVVDPAPQGSEKGL